MAKIELVRFLSDSAGDALNKAQDAKPETMKILLDEAEELLALATSVLNRPTAELLEAREAA
tara:strand:+ start:1088 stop:1273 length:186 start_codon:yes stop_codon:yes gene_type:complete